MNFTLDYKLYLGGDLIKKGTFKVKNKYSLVHSKSSLEDYLRKTYTFDRMEAKESFDMPDIFKDIFKF